jgi:hypothetical protein
VPSSSARERSWSLAIHGQSAQLLPPVAASKREEAFVASARGSHNVSVSAGMRDAAGSMQPARTRSAGPFRRGSEAANGGCRCARTRGGIDSTPASRCSRQAAAASEGWMRCAARRCESGGLVEQRGVCYHVTASVGAAPSPQRHLRRSALRLSDGQDSAWTLASARRHVGSPLVCLLASRRLRTAAEPAARRCSTPLQGLA